MQDVTGLFAESEYLGKVKSVSDIWLLKFRERNGSYAYAVWSTGASTSAKLILDVSAAGELNIQKVGSDPIAVTKASFEAGSDAINVAVSSIPQIIWASSANINITETTNQVGSVNRNVAGIMYGARMAPSLVTVKRMRDFVKTCI